MNGSAPIVGRDGEVAAVLGFIGDDGAAGQPCLLIEGEAGIGKTRLWEAGVARAHELGHTVLACRAVEGEVTLPFVGLGDLLGDVLDGVLSELPEVQRTALEVALLRRPTGDAPADRLASSRAVLGVLERLAEAGPTTLAIDDVQWLDPPTARVFEFACRRLSNVDVRLLLSRRSDDDEPPPLGLADGSVSRLRIGPLSAVDVGRLLADTLSLQLPRPRLMQLHATSGGNPYFALEIGRALLRQGAAEDGPLPVPTRIGELLRLRLDRLSRDGRDSALLCAASTQPTAATVERAAGTTAGLEEALREQVLELDGTRLRFSHPLLGSVAYASATPWERREAHRRLARSTAEREDRARHLALDTDEPDEEVAAELEDAAGLASARGAPETAAILMERAGSPQRPSSTSSPATPLVHAGSSSSSSPTSRLGPSVRIFSGSWVISATTTKSPSPVASKRSRNRPARRRSPPPCTSSSQP